MIKQLDFLQLNSAGGGVGGQVRWWRVMMSVGEAVGKAVGDWPVI
ncbi:hypothetical protein [Paenibacillus sp. Soil766]|nr:hypothetical protein [Paenibacillus sp. Soil766]